MHPGPMNRGVEIDGVVADDIDRSAILDQVEMGVAVRMAVPRRADPAPARGGRLSRPRRWSSTRRLLDPASGLDAPGGLLVVRRPDRRARPGVTAALARAGPR